jgi:hypothetical protein
MSRGPLFFAFTAEVERRRWLDRWFVVELLASALTLAGMRLGSTTSAGAALYLGSLVFWYLLTWRKRLWGLMPLNVASTVVAGLTLWAVR